MTLYRQPNLANVHPDLVRLAQDVGSLRDLIVVQGARTVAEELTAMASHHSALKNPMNSLHVTDPVKRPLALAVDLTPYPLDWNNLSDFQDLGAFVKDRAAALGIAIQWGGDWVSFRDYDHFQLEQAT